MAVPCGVGRAVIGAAPGQLRRELDGAIRVRRYRADRRHTDVATLLLLQIRHDVGLRSAPIAQAQQLPGPQPRKPVIEYASLTCTYCARFSVNVYPALKSRHVTVVDHEMDT
jgi:hypothetical protein